MAIIMSATHPNVAPILDGCHYWFGLSKLEGIDLIRPGEIGYVRIFRVCPNGARIAGFFHAHHTRRRSEHADANSRRGPPTRHCSQASTPSPTSLAAHSLLRSTL
jgi:hypothetical protein